MKQSIASDTIKLTTSKIITLTISMITAMLLSRFRTLEEYGTYSQILMVIQLVTTFFMLGLPNSINYFLAKADNDTERGKFISTYYTLSTILGFLIGLVLVLSTPLIIKFFDNPLIKNFWYVLAVYPWAKIITSSIDNMLIVYKKTHILMIFRILNSIFILSAVLIVQFLNLGFNEYMIIFVLGQAGFALIVYILAKKLSCEMQFKINKNLGKDIFSFSLPIGLGSFIGTLKTELDKITISWFYNTEQLAIYTNAAREMPVTIIASSLTSVLLPQVVRLLKKEENEKAINLWGDATSLSYLIICFLAIGIFAYAPEALTLLYSEKYLPGVPVFRIYAIVLLFRCTYFGMMLNASGNTKLIFKSTVISLTVDISLNFILYYTIGFIGPALSTLIATVVSASYLLIATSKVLNIPFRKVFPWKNILLITILNICLGLIFTFIKKLLDLDLIVGGVSEALILAVIWFVVYFAITFKFAKNKWKELNE